MFDGRMSKHDFVEIYDRVTSKLASWKSRLLNKPGRVVLANSVLSSLPYYHMQITWFPQGVCDDLDRMVRRFIWKGTGDKGMHLVGWNKIIQPRKFGGLGVRNARLHNVALLGKLVWEILHCPNKLWVQLFNDKYLRGQLPFKVVISDGSLIWKSVAKALQRLEDGFVLKIGNGNSSFWFDSWICKEKMSSMVPFVAIQDTQLKINDVWFDDTWNLQLLYTSIPDEMRPRILALQPRIAHDIDDVWTWHHSSSGGYTVKEAYQWLLNPVVLDNQSSWQWIWRLQLPASIQFFVWQVLQHSIPTRDVLHSRKVCNLNQCPRCLQVVESIDHCLFSCVEAVKIWQAIGLQQLLSNIRGADAFARFKQLDKLHGNIGFIVMWFIWCARNDEVFDNRKASVITTVNKIHAMLHTCSTVFGTSTGSSSNTISPQLVSWSKPREGFICLNVDGSLLGSPSTACYGGLVRNYAGSFLWGFYGVAALNNILFGELMAILLGLQQCWDNGFRKIICYSDSLQSVNLIRNGVSAHHRFANEIHNIRKLLSLDWEVEIVTSNFNY